MLTRNKELLIQSTECLRYMVPLELLDQWWENPNHIMLAEGDNVGIATLEYPGVFTCHWYFQSARGREAISLGKKMVHYLFEHCDAKVIRGLIRVDLKASRWAIRQVGLKSYGKVKHAGGEETELFIIDKEEFLQKEQMNNG